MTEPTTTLNWGILSTGNIAVKYAKALAQSKTGRLVAVGSRTQQAADAFGSDFPGIRCHGSYEALLADPAVQAVYIATPHPQHAQWAIRAAEAGKHILCEKPMTLNHAEARAVVEAARRHNVFLMEAFMYFCNPQMDALRDLIRKKVIGDVRLIQASYSFNCPAPPESRIYNNKLGGGGILDLGCYCTSLARRVAGWAADREFAEPVEFSGSGVVGPTRVDELALATLKFPGDVLAQISCGIRVAQANEITILGSAGRIRIPRPWSPGEGVYKIEVLVYAEKETRTLEFPLERSLFAVEADAVAAHLAERQSPVMSWDDTLGNMRTLDRWRQALGVVFDSDRTVLNLESDTP